MERASLNVDGTSSTVNPKVRKDCGGFRQLSQTKRQKRQVA